LSEQDTDLSFILKNTIHRFLNLALYISFCGMIGSGLLLAWRLPPGSRGGQGLSAMGLGRHDWGDIHTWLGYGVVALIVFHLAMNWVWLRKIAGGGRWWRLLLGLIAGGVLIASFLIVPVTKSGSRGEHSRAEKAAGH